MGCHQRALLMTKKKPIKTEVVEGAGASAGIVLNLKPGSKSGYNGVTPNGTKWRARVYKAAKKTWDTIGTYDSPKEAAIQAAIAMKEIEQGFGSFYSPLKQRRTTGAPILQTPHVCSSAQCTTSWANRDAPRYPVCAPLRSMGLSGCGRGVRLQLPDQSSCLRFACIRPEPHVPATRQLPLTASMRPQIPPWLRSLSTPRMERMWPRSIRCSNRRKNLIGLRCLAP